MNNKGLTAISYNQQSLLGAPSDGALSPEQPTAAASGDGSFSEASPTTSLDPATNKLTLTYPWGRVACAYAPQDDQLIMKVEVTNTSDQAFDLPVVLASLTFPVVPYADTLEAGMFGYGFKGAIHPLHEFPLVLNPRFAAPILQVDYGTGTINFCSDDCRATISVPETSNPPAKTKYPFMVSFKNIKAGSSQSATVSLRFGPPRAPVTDLSGDVLKRYAETYPFALRWQDRRPIGMIFLASSGIKVATNPRRWIMNDGKLDVTTSEGRASFRAALLKLADNSVKILKDANAQGMITWDPEGQEFLPSTYYGDPRLTSILAPETECKGKNGLQAMDEYFAKFRTAGLKVGVCIRPQTITIKNGQPKQNTARDQDAAEVLKKKIAYAREHWKCTLFYVDSTVTLTSSLDPAVFKIVAEAYPDVLLMPENESMRYFAYSAPLNSYVHHKITSTPIGARTVYPKSFSVLMAPDGDELGDHDALVAAIRNGDILLFNCWFNNPGIAKIKKLYREAAAQGAAPKHQAKVK